MNSLVEILKEKLEDLLTQTAKHEKENIKYEELIGALTDDLYH